MWSGVEDPPIPKLCTRWRWVVRFTLQPLLLRGSSEGT